MFDSKTKNLEHILKDKNLLIYGNNSLDKLNNIFDLFNKKIIQEITPYSIEMLKNIISENNIDLLIITSNEEEENIYKILLEISNYEQLIIFTCQFEGNLINENLINLSNSIFTNNIQEDIFAYKLYSNINNQIINIKKDENLDEKYIDSMELEIIFIRDELLHISKKLDQGEISENILQRSIQSVNRINRIFESYIMYSKKITNSIKNFDVILSKVNFQEVSQNNIESFEYLSRIIEDIAVFLDNYFIQRNFSNLYIVEDSLENSLKFLEDSFFNKNNDSKSELEFFDD